MNAGRAAKSLCGKTAQDIHKDKNGYADATESKDRDPNRPVCVTCQKKYRSHSRSPWKAWAQNAQGEKAK